MTSEVQLRSSPAVELHSPLTPALSPLRGEGVASGARLDSYVRRRVPASWSIRQDSWAHERVRGFPWSAARHRARRRANEFPKAPVAPSLSSDGERTGVRGEAVRGAPLAQTFRCIVAAATSAICVSPEAGL
jgi:hypothetical protein